MKQFAISLWQEEDGVLSFEWTLLVTLLCLGVVGGIAATRDAIIDELGDVAQAMQALDGSYVIDFPLVFTIDTTASGGGVFESNGGSDSQYQDFLAFSDCERAADPVGQLVDLGDDGDS